MAKANKLEYAQRVESVRQLILAGNDTPRVIQAVTEKWAVTDRQAWNYVRDARTNILAITKEVRPYLLAEHLAIRRDIRRRAQKAGDLQAELLAAKDEAKLLGLYPTDEQTGLHDTPIATVVTIFGHTEREEGDRGGAPRLSN
jgi:hypothetical protein